VIQLRTILKPKGCQKKPGIGIVALVIASDKGVEGFGEKTSGRVDDNLVARSVVAIKRVRGFVRG
jgi:hypothetical protein